MISMIRGKKTYFLGVGWIIWGVWSYVIENNEVEGIQRIMEGLGLVTLRAGISKHKTAQSM